MIKENREKLTNPSVFKFVSRISLSRFFLTKFHARNVFNEISRFFPPPSLRRQDELGASSAGTELQFRRELFPTDEERANVGGDDVIQR